MAYGNFKPLVWSSHIQHELPKFTVFEPDCDYRFKGEAGMGKTVKILGVARPTIGDYTGTDIGTPEIIPDSSVFLLIDQAKYFNFMVDDVDEAQATKGLMAALMEESTRAVAEARDDYIAELCALGASNASSSTAVSSSEGAQALVDAALETLWNAGVSPKDDVTMYLSPKLYRYMMAYIASLKTDNDKLVGSGILVAYSGARIKMSTNLYNDGTDDYSVVKTSKAVAFASCIESVEAYRPEGLFSDAIKGLNTYGGKVVRPKELYIIKSR
jgi:hypothetical protein